MFTTVTMYHRLLHKAEHSPENYVIFLVNRHFAANPRLLGFDRAKADAELRATAQVITA